MTRTITQAAFEEQYQRQREVSYRRNFVYLIAAYMAYTFGSAIFFLITTAGEVWADHANLAWLRIGAFGLTMAVLGGSLAIPNRLMHSSQAVLSIITMLVTVVGLLLMASRWPLQAVVTNYMVFGAVDLLVLHALACALLPWQPKEAIPPFLPLLAIFAIIIGLPQTSGDFVFKAVTIILAGATLLPGIIITVWKDRHFEDVINRELLGRKVKTMGGELSRARIVHDAMFPQEFDLGHVKFDYSYAPMQEIGGDYVHIHYCKETDRIYLTLLDVAGHGLAAALTVNRLFGELERVRAENRDAEPNEVMALLNRYIYLTMSNYSLFATGACIMLDCRTGEVKWVNAGHPPAFIRRGDGTVDQLGGTTMLMGVESYKEYDPGQKSTTLHPGDVIIAYTDGAIEARNGTGERFGIDRLHKTVSFDTPPRNWTRFIATAVDKHCDGRAEDDVLIAAITLNNLRIANLDGNQHSDEMSDSAIGAQAF